MKPIESSIDKRRRKFVQMCRSLTPAKPEVACARQTWGSGGWGAGVRRSTKKLQVRISSDDLTFE